MRRLRREILIRQAMVREDRQLLAAQLGLLRERAKHTLASPKALLAAGGIGFLAALLRGRRPAEAGPAAEPGWLQLLLREVAVPLVLCALQSRVGAEHPPDQE